MSEEDQVMEEVQANTGLTTSINIKSTSSSKPARKRVSVRFRPSDDLGATPMPEGYSAALASRSNQPAFTVPDSHYEQIRIQQERRPFMVSKKTKIDKKLTIRAAGGEVWEDPTLVHWDSGLTKTHDRGLPSVCW